VCPEKNRARQAGCPIEFKRDEPMDGYAAAESTEPNSSAIRKTHKKSSLTIAALEDE
jgi:hypothetical protein